MLFMKLKLPLASNVFVARGGHCDTGNARFVEASTLYGQPGMPLLPVKIKEFPPAGAAVTNFGDGGLLARVRRNTLACLPFKLTLKELLTDMAVPSHRLVAAKIPGGRPARLKVTGSFVAPAAEAQK